MSIPQAAAPGFSERQFYQQEFRGRTLAIALAETGPADPALLSPALSALVEGGARAVVLAAERARLEKAGATPVLETSAPRLEGEVWRRLRERGRVGIAVGSAPAFAAAVRNLTVRLGLAKLVWIDAGGGLQRAGGERASFLDMDELRRLLAADGPLRLDARLPLWRQVEALLESGIAAVNVCDLPGVENELFTYAGSGTLFTRERYVSVRLLGVDDYDAAHDLLRRGQEEGYLAPRTPEQIDEVLASGFGAFVENHHLAGIGALLVRPGGRIGEIASLYTLTRFLGEGIGAHLVAFAARRARALGLDAVAACTTSDRVGGFFERQGFRAAAPEEIPSEKWRGYDPERRERVRCYRLDLAL
jgi:N-acetylglutamate synthase-like GNAT family acetyltransferase